MKLIESAEAKQALAEQYDEGRGTTYNMAVASCISALRAVHEYDVHNPTEPQGQWIIKELKHYTKYYVFECSRCGSRISAKRIGKRRFNYCPFCGALMVTTDRVRGELKRNKK